MASRLIPVSHHDFVARMRELGFRGPLTGGRHPQMIRGNHTVIIPNPHAGDITTGLLRRVLRQAAVTPDEWLG